MGPCCQICGLNKTSSSYETCADCVKMRESLTPEQRKWVDDMRYHALHQGKIIGRYGGEE